MLHNTASSPPPHVIHTIMRYATSLYGALEARRWRYMLPFLAINHTWRIHSLPMIYRYAFYSDIDGSVMDPVNTNIELVSEGHFSCYAHVFTVDLGNRECLARFLDTYKNILKFGSNDWGQVTQFSFTLRDESAIPDRFNSDEHPEGRKCQYVEFAQHIINNMPIVRWLKIRCNDNSSVGRAANKLLLEAFGWQLVYFDGTFVSSFTARQHFANITCLKIEFNNAAEHLLPTINSRRLKYMYLLDIPARFSWKYFCGGQNDSDTIVFSSLTSLCLRFKDDCFEYHTDMMVDCIEIDAEDSAADNTPYRVEFPKLESLFVRDSIEDSILGCTYVFPTELESLNVFNSLETFGLLKQSGVKTVTRIVAEFYQITSDEENEFYEYTNWAYRTGNQSRDKYLSVHNCGFKFNWERMEWSGVTQLQITECNMQTFKAILFYSPRLEVLQVRILVLEGETDKPYAIGSEFVGNSSFSAISPSESLSRICVQEIHDIEKTLDHAMLLFQTMIQRFEHLEKIGVPRRLISSIAQYVERNKADYPHLEGIKVVDFINY